VGNYVEVISDFDYTSGGFPSEFKIALDGDYHPLGGNASTQIQSNNFVGVSSVLTTTNTYIKLAEGLNLDAANTGSGLAVGAESATIIYDGSDDTADTFGLRWQMSGPDYSPSDQIIATREYIAANYLTGTGSGIGTGDLANYYTKTEIDASYIYSSTIKGANPTILDIDNWAPLIIYNETGAPAWANTIATIANSFNQVVRRDAIGDIYATTGHLVATSALYADLAEKYTCDETLPVGTVVAVAMGGEYEVVEFDFDTAFNVVGVVSENPAHLMNSESAGLPIALTGRVPVRVVGEIRRGDFIVASSVNKGCAIKGSFDNNYERKIGFVLETNLQDGEKMVECIIK
jgi:hypothetical protein